MNSDEEIARLRAEVARLEGQVALGHRATMDAAPAAAARSARGGLWLSVVVVASLVLVGVLGPLAVVARWAHDEVGDTDRYLATIAPLASNPNVQEAITQRITEEIFARIDVKAITQDAVDSLEQRGLGPRAATALSALSSPLSDGIHSFVEKQVRSVVHSSAFRSAWVEANRQAHDGLVAVLVGRTGGDVEFSDGAVRVNLAAVIETVKQALVDAGFTLAQQIPTIQAQFTLVESADLVKAQTAFRLLNLASAVLPWLALLLLGLAVWLSRDRRRTLVIGALVVAVSMVLLGASLNLFRIAYLDALPKAVPVAAAGDVYDALAGSIRVLTRSLLVAFLLVASVAWVTGPGPAPRSLRRGAGVALDAVRTRSDRAGLDTGPVGRVLHTYRVPIRVGVLAVALLAYVLADRPTAGFTLTVFAVAALVLLVVELLARPAAAPPSGPQTSGPQ